MFYTVIDGIKVKILPYNIGELQTARGLAYWIMDDGFKDGNGLVLAINNFTESDIELLRNVLHTKFGLNTTKRIIYVKSF